ncbi:type II secretion system protein [Bengtsoniella intestinalis]|uniref:type IV pilin protein n=1 Tax=Bengtsoniella intestinalis TaxID=3073143 RepID=UPI00391F5CDC
MKKVLKNKKGFTLVELIVVIAILAVLAMIAIPTFSGILNDATDAKNESEARNVFLLAQMEFIEASVSGETPDYTDLATQAGLDASVSIVVTSDTDAITSVTVDGYTYPTVD